MICALNVSIYINKKFITAALSTILMGSFGEISGLENVLEVTAAILNQKGKGRDSLPGIVESLLGEEKGLFEKGEKLLDLGTSIWDKTKKEYNPRKLINFFKKEIYNPLNALSEYISKANSRLYKYYSKAKDALKDIALKIGYTDKLLMEFEDWGTVYFKSAFRKLVRLTPMGIVQNYLEHLWIYLAKKAW